MARAAGVGVRGAPECHSRGREKRERGRGAERRALAHPPDRPLSPHRSPPPPQTQHFQAQASLAKVAQFAGVAASSLLLTAAANAATIKLGSDSGALVFEPAAVTVAAGEEITFVNNAGFPHNIVFDEDEVPAGVNTEAISREDYLNAPGETYVSWSRAGAESKRRLARLARPPARALLPSPPRRPDDRSRARPFFPPLSLAPLPPPHTNSQKVKLSEKGTYSYYCEPHRGAGMQGKITVN